MSQPQILPSRGPGLENPFLDPPLIRKLLDSDLEAGLATNTTTFVGFLPYIIPPRSRVLRGGFGGDTVPTSAGNAGFQVQLYTMDELTFMPGTMISETATYNIVGAGALLDVTDTVLWGLPKGTGQWHVFFTPPSGWQNDSYHDPLYVSLAFQLQGGGAYTAGHWRTWLRNEEGPAVGKINAAQAWQYTFVNNPTVVKAGSGDLSARPDIRLQLVRL